MQTEMKKIFYLIFIGRPGISVIQSATINDFRVTPLIIIEHAILPGASPRHLNTNLSETIIKGRRPGISVIQSATINDFRELPLIIMVQAYML